jgi:hypothetical protein
MHAFHTPKLNNWKDWWATDYLDVLSSYEDKHWLNMGKWGWGEPKEAIFADQDTANFLHKIIQEFMPLLNLEDFNMHFLKMQPFSVFVTHWWWSVSTEEKQQQKRVLYEM